MSRTPKCGYCGQDLPPSRTSCYRCREDWALLQAIDGIRRNPFPEGETPTPIALKEAPAKAPSSSSGAPVAAYCTSCGKPNDNAPSDACLSCVREMLAAWGP